MQNGGFRFSWVWFQPFHTEADVGGEVIRAPTIYARYPAGPQHEENHAWLLQAVEGRSKREVQNLIAGLTPRPDVRTSLRKLSAPPTAAVVPTAEDRKIAVVTSAPITDAAGARLPTGAPPAVQELTAAVSAVPSLPLLSRAQAAASDASLGAALPSIKASQALPHCPPAPPPTPPAPRPAEIRPLAPARYSLRVTISEETYGKLRQAQDLLRHNVPDGDPAAIRKGATATAGYHVPGGIVGAAGAVGISHQRGDLGPSTVLTIE